MKIGNALFLSALFLSGCATVETYQADCEKANPQFKDMTECLRSSVSSDIRFSRSQEAKLYLLKAEQLSQRVESGQISELDARAELQKLYVELDASSSAQHAAAASAAAAWKPKQTRCTPIGNTVSCNTY